MVRRTNQNRGYNKRTRARRSHGATYRRIIAKRPRTTSFRIVFPWVDTDYSLAEFSNRVTDGKITRKEVESVFQRLRKTVHGYDVEFETQCTGANIGLFALILIGSFFIPVFGLIIGFAVIWVMESGKKQVKQKLLEARTQRLKMALKKINFEWVDKQVNWSVGELGAWLQLDLKYKMGGAAMTNGPKTRGANNRANNNRRNGPPQPLARPLLNPGQRPGQIPLRPAPPARNHPPATPNGPRPPAAQNRPPVVQNPPPAPPTALKVQTSFPPIQQINVPYKPPQRPAPKPYTSPQPPARPFQPPAPTRPPTNRNQNAPGNNANRAQNPPQNQNYGGIDYPLPPEEENQVIGFDSQINPSRPPVNNNSSRNNNFVYSELPGQSHRSRAG